MQEGDDEGEEGEASDQGEGQIDDRGEEDAEDEDDDINA